MKRDNGKAYIELHNKRASSAVVSRKNHGGGGGATNAFDVPPNEVVLAGAGSRRPPSRVSRGPSINESAGSNWRSGV